MRRVTRMTRRTPPRPPCDRCKSDRWRSSFRPCKTCGACACRFCEKPIQVGEVYRLRYWICDSHDDPPVTVAHESCVRVYGDPHDVWSLTETRDGRAARRSRHLESLDYIHKAYGLRLMPGQRVSVPGATASDPRRAGWVVRGTHHVLVKLRRTSDEVKKRHKMEGWWHPREVQPLDHTREGVRTRWPRKTKQSSSAPATRPTTSTESTHDDLPF